MNGRLIHDILKVINTSFCFHLQKDTLMTFIEIYLLAGLAILGFNTLLWGISLLIKDASIIDPFWSILFLMAGIVYAVFSEDGYSGRKILLMTLVTIWALRLFIYLAWRNWGHGEDFRYQKWRDQHGDKWWWRSYLQVFVLQGMLAWIISIPLLAAQHSDSPDKLTIVDGFAILVWGYGFFFEAVGDFQLARFKAHPANKGKVLNSGVWRYTRHPNYFGDAAQWWGYFLITLAAGGWWTIYAPLMMTGLLLKVSGVALLEKSLTKTKPQYADYIERTSAFVPWFPKKPASD